MTKIEHKWVQAMKDRHGRWRYYFRRKGYPKATLPGLPGSAEFMAAYQAALALQPPPIGASRNAPGTMSALIAAWQGRAEFRQLEPSTQSVYRNILSRLDAKHGHRVVAELKPMHVFKLRESFSEHPTSANRMVRLLGQMMQFALERGWPGIETNPCRDVKRIKVKSDGHHSWTDAEIDQFVARHPPGTKPHLALSLLLYTGQRRSDAVKMGRQHIKDGRISVVQQKTGARLSLPIHWKLAEAIAACSSEHLAFLVTKSGKPFTANGFGNWFGDRCRQAGLPEGCSAHGLRKAAGRRLAEAGCTPHEIMSILGHKSLSEAERYTRGADQERLSDSGMARIGGAKTPEP